MVPPFQLTLKTIYPHLHLDHLDQLDHHIELDEQNMLALMAILDETIDLACLNGHGGLHYRQLVAILKNSLGPLERLLQHLQDCDIDIGDGSYFFTNVKSNETFDLYRRYDVSNFNLQRANVTADQWKYMSDIGFITQEQYNNALN